MTVPGEIINADGDIAVLLDGTIIARRHGFVALTRVQAAKAEKYGWHPVGPVLGSELMTYQRQCSAPEPPPLLGEPA